MNSALQTNHHLCTYAGLLEFPIICNTFTTTQLPCHHHHHGWLTLCLHSVSFTDWVCPNTAADNFPQKFRFRNTCPTNHPSIHPHGPTAAAVATAPDCVCATQWPFSRPRHHHHQHSRRRVVCGQSKSGDEQYNKWKWCLLWCCGSTHSHTLPN